MADVIERAPPAVTCAAVNNRHHAGGLERWKLGHGETAAMIRRNAVRCLMSASLVALAAAPAPAFAQHIDRIVAFGDSYADDGNLFQIVGITPPIVYSTGRFSGGTNYIDTLSDILNVPVERPGNLETTALGAAYFAGLTTGVWPSVPAIAKTWSRADRFEPQLDERRRKALLAGWRDALSRTLRD